MTNLFRPTIPNTYSRVLLGMMETKGIAAKSLLAGSNITEAQIAKADQNLSPLQHAQIVSAAVASSNDPGLGLQLGQRIGLTSMGPLGQAIIASANVKQALETIEKYLKTRCALLTARVFVEEDQVVVELDEAVGLAEYLPVTIEAVMTALYQLSTSLLMDKPVSTELRFSYPRPKYVEEYERVFKAPFSFERGGNQIRFDISVLDQPMPLASAEAYQVAVAQCELKMKELEKMQSLMTKVKDRLRENPNEFPSLNAMAELCYVSPRTLTRRLRKLNTSYQQVLDSYRCSLAKEYLRNNAMTVEEISRRMGYNDPSNFGRAFKSWTGRSPSYFRNMQIRQLNAVANRFGDLQRLGKNALGISINRQGSSSGINSNKVAISDCKEQKLESISEGDSQVCLA